MSETRLLDQPVMEILKDHRLTNPVLQAFSTAQGISYPDALQRFQDNIAAAGGPATLKQGLRGADAEFVADTVRLLDRRDAVLDAMVTAENQLRRDPRGVVTLDQGDGSVTADRAAALRTRPNGYDGGIVRATSTRGTTAATAAPCSTSRTSPACNRASTS